jgi:cell fate regulator YaaT (PSP1 superfamily)
MNEDILNLTEEIKSKKSAEPPVKEPEKAEQQSEQSEQPEQEQQEVEIIGVRFKSVGKIYYFAPEGMKLPSGTMVVVETSRGTEVGTVVLTNRMIPQSKLRGGLRPILRVVNDDDLRRIAENNARVTELMKTFTERIKAHNLTMKPYDAEVSFDGTKITFRFGSDSRVDFRELVKDLASIYRTRIELRQLGVRDEAKMLGGLAVCGRALCCASFLGEFQPVAIKMAKEQSLSLNPVKISGTCGRLMCCLKYEQDSYEELLKITPKVGAFVETQKGKGVVEEANLLTGMLKIRIGRGDDSTIVTLNKDEVKLLRDGRIQIRKEELDALRELEK